MINTGNRHIYKKIKNLDLHELIKLQKEFENNPVIGYLNIKHFDSKIGVLRDICGKLTIDAFCIDKTKSDSSCPYPQLKFSGYQFHRSENTETDMVVVKVCF